MKLSLNLIKKYIDLPSNLTIDKIAYDLTLRTVEVEEYEDTAKKFHDIVVGKILEVKDHPNADALKICMVDIGDETPKQIVCGGINLYKDEMVVISKPGSEVYWHGEDSLVTIKETKMRGEDSYGMICGATEVYLDQMFPPKDEREIVDLKGIDCYPGQPIADVVCMNDATIEIDNKSLTNRPDLWGAYGIARELSAIYDLPLKELPEVKLDRKLPKYKIEIKEPTKCNRYFGIEIDNVYDKESPMWMQATLINCGLRPISAIVDITNYAMIAVGQPSHAFDKTHVEGEKIVVRNAKKNEKLLLLDNQEIELTEDDLVICDTKEPMCLAGIRGGAKDSILPETTGVLLEVANFSAGTIRKTGKRFAEKTDSSIRYEKGIDTDRVSQGVAVSLELFKELFPECEIVAWDDVVANKTERAKIEVSKDFLDRRLGKVLSEETITKTLELLGYDVKYTKGVFKVAAPVFRSTGDVSIKDDVMGDIARILSFDSFEAKGITITFDKAVKQPEVLLERRLREYLAYRCGFNEIFTYPWIDDKYIKAAGVDTSKSVRLATPPAPELAILRSSLVPGMLEAIHNNLRYYDEFKMFECTQVFENGEYHESTEEETLPVHKKYLTGCAVGKDARKLFYDIKGVLERLGGYCQFDDLKFTQEEKPGWADVNAYLSIKYRNQTIGYLGLVSIGTMNECKIKHANIAVFEMQIDGLVPFASRTNKFEHLPQLPLVEKDLSVIVDENVTWEEISGPIKGKVKELIFVDEYRGNQIPKGKKSISFRFKIENTDTTMTSEEINNKMNQILKTLENRCNAKLREE